MKIRFAKPEDMPAVWALIYELAVYEKAPEQVVTTAETMIRDGFGESPLFQCLVAENDNAEIVGTAVFYYAYSTWKGKMIYLDDLVVTETCRRGGAGLMLMNTLREIAEESGVKQIRWHVLDWNEPAIRFYQKMKADLDSEWIQCKIHLE